MSQKGKLETSQTVCPAMFKNIWEKSSSFPIFCFEPVNNTPTYWTEEPVCVNLQGDNICIGLFQSDGKRILQINNNKTVQISTTMQLWTTLSV